MAKFHMIGIKGAGMSALTQVLHDMGHEVQGSDLDTYFFTQAPLEQKRIPLYSFDADRVAELNDRVIVASNAFKDDHPEVEASLRAELPFYRYHTFLGDLIGRYTSVAVTGAHGKTSTTGMLAHVCKAIKPTSYLIGDGTGAGVPDSTHFIFESCEYRRHFLAYAPDYAIITNIDFDHPDYFSGLDDVTLAFQQMTDRVKKHVVAFGDDDQVRSLRPPVPILLYGFGEHNALRAADVRVEEEGLSFEALLHDNKLGRFQIPGFGRHNVLNALAVIGICVLEDFNLDQVRAEMMTFGGVKRRFTEKLVAGNVLIDDYAHHPTEIRATLDAVRTKYPNRQVVSVFQPHTYSRLEKFMDDFAHSLSASDQVYLCGIFGSARENKGNISIEQLMERIPSSKLLSEQNVDYALKDYSDCVLLFMGAGDVHKYQQKYEDTMAVL
ncbi:UDP-N-acetylmuramate--L-alanine ligase [Paenibacillus koleovorans]|uniref:UDP-N-acetylmuramate--L-alanine ligase n=1 Tax=Paenibacillus koleovorans TaxID=121608 RepID=UPI000FDA40D7|nr:UDP-N-acetylmuramate--L-alanine ligase [Paenibacillus koleovorans]